MLDFILYKSQNTSCWFLSRYACQILGRAETSTQIQWLEHEHNHADVDLASQATRVLHGESITDQASPRTFWAWVAENRAERAGRPLDTLRTHNIITYDVYSLYARLKGAFASWRGPTAALFGVSRTPGPHSHVATVAHSIPPEAACDTMAIWCAVFVA